MAKSFSTKDIDRGFKRIVREMGKAKEPHSKIGVLSDQSTWASGEGDISANLADIATFNEFGTSDIPARPFMAQSFDGNSESVAHFIQKQHGLVLDGKATMEIALKAIGVFFEGIVKKTIASGGFAANAPSTIAQKGSSKPLIDTGRLRQSIASQVVMHGGLNE